MRSFLTMFAMFVLGCSSPDPQQSEPEMTREDKLRWSVQEKCESPEELKVTRLFGSEAAQQTVKKATSVEYFLLNRQGEIVATAQDSITAGSGIAGLLNCPLVYQWDADLSKGFVPNLKCRYQDDAQIVDVSIDCATKVFEVHVNGQMTGRAQLNEAVDTKFRFVLDSLKEKHFPNEILPKK